MTKLTVAVLVGSLRKDSCNLKLAKAISTLGKDHLDMHILSLADLPLFNQDLESNFPSTATQLKNAVAKADAILFVTPEYNRGVSGVLKNAIDWISRPYGQNSFSKKPGAICGASVGSIGTACAQNALKSTLNYLEIALMGQPEVYLHFKENLIDTEGHISDPGTEKFLQGFTNQFIAWIQQHK